MAIHQYKAYHLHELIEIIEELGNARRIGEHIPPVLWARGHRKQERNLIPTLVRSVNLGTVAGTGNIKKRALEEEFRKEHYIAKNYHYFTKAPQTSVEWLEVMQHHGVRTRMLDWSESVLHALVFSVECFLDNTKYHDDDRVDSSPCIWILEPIEWNRAALSEIVGDISLIDRCMDMLPGANAGQKRKIRARIRNLSGILDDYMKMDSARHLSGIFNLSSIAAEMQRMQKDELLYVLEYGEIYFCLNYMINCLYLSTSLWDMGQVLPLSIVESYHSERIRAQKGTFTVFPYYREDQQYHAAKAMNIQLDAMEYMEKGNNYLHKILLCDPWKIAYEIMSTGMNTTWLYPELPIVANTIESRRIYI